MSQFVDFVGLNTFIYEANGYIPERISSNGAFLEYVTGDGIAYKLGSVSTQLGYAVTLNNHIGSYGFSQPNTYPLILTNYKTTNSLCFFQPAWSPESHHPLLISQR